MHPITSTIPKLLAASMAALFAITPVWAASPRYTFVEAGYGYLELDDPGILGDDPDGDGYFLGGSVAVADMVHLFASYGDSELDVLGFDVDYSTIVAGLGLNVAVSDSVDVVGRLAYVDAEVDVSGFGSDDESGYGLAGGVRAMVTDQFELNGFLNYVDLGDDADDTTFSVGALYNFTEMFAVGIGAEVGDDSRAFTAGARLYFGK